MPSQVRYSAGGQPLRVSMHIGHGQVGAYTFSLNDSRRRFERVLLSGHNADADPDFFTLPADADLDNKFIAWICWVSSPAGTPDENYSVAVKVEQGGVELQGAPPPAKGKTGTEEKLTHGTFQLIRI